MQFKVNKSLVNDQVSITSSSNQHKNWVHCVPIKLTKTCVAVYELYTQVEMSSNTENGTFLTIRAHVLSNQAKMPNMEIHLASKKRRDLNKRWLLWIDYDNVVK